MLHLLIRCFPFTVRLFVYKRRKDISMNEILLLWCLPEHSTTSIKGWRTTGVHCTLARLVIIEPDMIIRSCDGSVAPPPCMHTQTRALETKNKNKNLQWRLKHSLSVVVKKIFLKRGERGSSPFQRENVSAGAL